MQQATGSRQQAMPDPKLPVAGCRLPVACCLFLVIAASCAHKARSPGAGANPIAPVVVPKTNAEAQAAFDEGVRLMKMGKRHYKEARKTLTRATDLDGHLFE